MTDGEQPQGPELEWNEPDETDTNTSAQVEEVTFQFPVLRSDKVAIVGFAGGHAHQAPFGDESVETWGINQLWKQLPDRRWDRWFELHSLYDFYHANPPHQQWLREFPGPVYVRAQDYRLALEWGIRTAQPFPDQVLLDTFRPYFTNTISWLIALAIMLRPSELSLYGVDMAQDHVLAAEYSQQRPSCEYFLGLAEASGIRVKLPHGSDLLKATHLYGYEDSGAVLEKMTNRFTELEKNKGLLAQQVAQIEQQLAAARAQQAAMEGAQNEMRYWRKNWLTPPTRE